jgi:hypothetical protein
MVSSTTLNELTRVKYVGQDFKTYSDESEDFLKTNYPTEYTDYVNNNLGVALLQSIAWPMQNLAFYVNQRITNLYLTESSSTVAISRLARMLNYDIQPAIPFQVSVTVALDQVYTYPISIVKGFRFSASKGLTYEYRGTNPIIYSPGETQKTFVITEGVTTRNVFISTGLANQRFTLAGLETGDYIALNSFNVTVGPALWTEVRRITFDATAIYEVNYFSDPPEIRFGDGIAGLVPENNQEIVVDFVICHGIQGAVGTNEILNAQDQLVVKNANVGLTIVSATEATGGDDPEDLRKVKVMAPEFYQSQNRAITKRDYDALTNTYPGIAKGDAQIIRSIDQDVVLNGLLDSYADAVSGVSGSVQTDIATITTNLRNYLAATLSDTCMSNTVQVSVLAKNGSNRYAATTPALREDLRSYLEGINDIVQVVSVVDGSPHLVPVDIEIEIQVNFNSIEDDVLENARLALVKDDAEPYGLLILREYGTSLYLSDLYEQIRANQTNTWDIDYMNIKITGPTSKLDANGNLIINAAMQETIQPGTITIKSIPLSTGL